MSSVDMPDTRKEEPEQKPGAGIDRTVMRRLLELTPAERLKIAVEEANRLEHFFNTMRRR